jgi:GDP-L-fucose synthase
MKEKVLVTGGTGFLGSHLLPLINREKYEVYSIGKRDVDLTKFEDAQKLFSNNQFDMVIHLAALSGGIGANRARPYDFFHQNTLLVANIFNLAAEFKVKKVIYTMGGCSYPNTAHSPIGEDQMWNGFPHGDSAAYSSAKKMGIVAAQAYSQLGLKSTVLVPGNLYGEFDNYSLEQSHVIPAMIRKFFEAKRMGRETVPMWGSGIATRDFVYAKDVARIIANKMDHDLPLGPINISSGTSISIKSLAELISNLMDYQGQIEWDKSKPDGQLNKIFDVQYAKSLGMEASTELETGLTNTIQWFEENYESGLIRL